MATFGFTRASGQDFFTAETPQQSTSRSQSALSGEDARHFYESLMQDGIEEPSQSVFNPKSTERRPGKSRKNREPRRRSSRRVRDEPGSAVLSQTGRETEVVRRQETTTRERSDSERCAELRGLRLLRCAHNGDISGLKELLLTGVDVNFQDTFFWTAVMCASWSGQRAAVRLLLKHGAAWVGVVDTQGRDAKDLALEAGHSDVLKELENYGRDPQQDRKSDRSSLPTRRCDVCGASFSSSLSSHVSSTVHQFSLRRPLPTPYYCLPASSNSYKMMLSCGWKPGTGLGPGGEGPHQPVATVLKRDQKGLGFGPVKTAKVTHFKAKDHDAVKPWKYKEERIGKGKKREETRRKEQRDKNWEIDFRTSFYL